MGTKNERLLHIALLLLLISPPPAESFIFTAIMTAVSFAYQAYQIVNDAHDTYKKFAPQTTLDDVLDQAKQVEAKVDQIGEKLSNQIGQAVNTIVTRIDDMNHIREGLSKLSGGVRRIDNLYRLFELYTAKKIRLNNHTLQNYINQVTTVGANAPKDILSDISELIVPTSGLQQSFLYYITKDAPEDDTNICGIGSPAQTRYYQLFRLIMVNEIRAFTMMTFSYSLDQVFKCESFGGEIDYAEYELQTRARDYYDVFSIIAERTSNTIRNCDPADGWIRGKNFFELDRFATDYVVSAKNFWKYYTHCDPGCGADWVRKLAVEICKDDYGCREDTRCKGGLINCKKIPDPATVCELQPTGRRYQYIKTGDGETTGNSSECGGEVIEIPFKNNCDVCRCTCLEENPLSKSLRTFSTRKQISDVENNKVVTGVKFVVKGNMVHLQIQQGKALPEGRIVAKSVDWKPLEDINFDEQATSNNRKLTYYISSDDGSREELKEIKDFVSLSWEQHVIHIDDLEVQPGYVVTGVKFNTNGDNPRYQPIELAIQASPFDYDTGKIEITDDNPAIWLRPADMVGRHSAYDRERKQLNISELLNPLTETGQTSPRSSPNSFIEVVNTASKGDGGQTTLPLFDAQPITGKPPIAAGGMGFYYKSVSEDVGGFVAIRLAALQTMENMKIAALDQLDQYKEQTTAFKGCNDAIGEKK